MTMDRNYLQVSTEKINPEKFVEYEKLEAVDYIIPGDSIATFKVTFDDYLQTSRYTIELSGSLVSYDKLSENDITAGRMPKNEYEVVVDKKAIDNMKSQGSGAYMGIKDASEMIGKFIEVNNLNKFEIVRYFW